MARTKTGLREQLKADRMGLSAQQVAAKSSAICHKAISAVDWLNIKSAHIYQANPAWREIDPQSLIDWLNKNYANIKIDRPSFDKAQSLPQSKYDLIIVPVMGFDKDNNRLGLGGGYYDRFLATQPEALKIGLAYQSAFVPGGIPREPHDIPLDRVVTEI